MVIYGYDYFVREMHNINRHLQKVGINIELGGADFFPFLNFMMGWFIATAVLVVAYGMREKFRTRFDECGHVPSCSAALIKFLVKAFIHFLVIACMVISILVFIFGEAVLVVLVASKEACDTGTDSLYAIIDLISSTNEDDLIPWDDDGQIAEEIDEICRQVKNSRDAAWNLCIGALVCLVGWITLVAYWYK
jgi:hypothetical protein